MSIVQLAPENGMPRAKSAAKTMARSPATTMPKIVKALDMGDLYPDALDDELKLASTGGVRIS